MMAWFEPGSSYTGEEGVEFFCHGGTLVLNRVLAACLDAGATLAGPGEFTRRAVLNGRLDLLQAEAVGLLAEAPTEEAVQAGLRQLSGEPSREVMLIHDHLMDLLASVEVTLDFPEEDDVEVDLVATEANLVAACGTLNEWLKTAEAVRPSLIGFRIALLGPPNAGKSSLFNALLGQGRAIVHDLPGTTRDVVGEGLVLNGVPCMLWDTAGLRESVDVVEAEGVSRAIQAARAADCRVLCLDGTRLESAEESVLAAQNCDILVLTKADIWVDAPDTPEWIARMQVETHRTSVTDGQGLDALRASLGERAAAAMQRGRGASLVISGARQEQAVIGTLRFLEEAISGVRNCAPAEIVASRIRLAAERLGEVTGRAVTEEVLARIFARFCVGK